MDDQTPEQRITDYLDANANRVSPREAIDTVRIPQPSDGGFVNYELVALSADDLRAVLADLAQTRVLLEQATAEAQAFHDQRSQLIDAGEYAGEVERLGAELAEAKRRLAFIAECTWGLSDSSDADVSMVAYALNDLAKGEKTVTEAIEAMPEEWRPQSAAGDDEAGATGARRAQEGRGGANEAGGQSETQEAAEGADSAVTGMRPTLRKPEEWEAEYGITIHDPDGWRYDNKPWNEAIELPEFQRRMGLSTVVNVATMDLSRLIADVRAAAGKGGTDG